MGRNTALGEKAISVRGHDVRLDYDPVAIRRIARESNSEAVKDADNYIRAVNFRGNMYCAIVDDTAFIAGTFCKKHFRLAEMAVSKERQKSGIGRFMLELLKNECGKRGIHKITCRTSTEETAYMFYQKIGGRITGVNGNDYEVEITF